MDAHVDNGVSAKTVAKAIIKSFKKQIETHYTVGPFVQRFLYI